MDSCRANVSPETQAFLAAVFGNPDPADTAEFVAAILGEDSFAPRVNFRESARVGGDLATGGPADDWLCTIGVEEAKKAADEWKSSQTWDTTKNAKLLRKSMEMDHTVFGPGEEPHHLVQSTDPRAAEGRALLDKYHIDLNGAENGIKLTRRVHQTSGLQRTEAIHDLNDRLQRAAEGAKSWNSARWRIMQQLGRTRRDINAGRFPCP